jgi:hypothetical protein
MNVTNSASFDATAADVSDMKSRGYRPRDHYEQNAALREVIDLVPSCEVGHDDANGQILSARSIRDYGECVWKLRPASLAG